MDPGIFHVQATATADFAREFFVEVDGAPLDLTDWTGFRYQVRAQPGQPGVPLIDIVGAGPSLAVYPLVGRLSLRIARDALLAIAGGDPLGFRRLHHELSGTDSDGRTFAFFYGFFDLYPGVVRA